MDIAKVLSSAAKVKATEVRVEIGEPTQAIVGGQLRTLFASAVKSEDFDMGITQRLPAFTREELRTTGRCQWQLEERGIGKIQAEVERTKARFLLPATPETRAVEQSPVEESAAPRLALRWKVVLVIGVLYMLGSYAWVYFFRS